MQLGEQVRHVSPWCGRRRCDRRRGFAFLGLVLPPIFGDGNEIVALWKSQQGGLFCGVPVLPLLKPRRGGTFFQFWAQSGATAALGRVSGDSIGIQPLRQILLAAVRHSYFGVRRSARVCGRWIPLERELVLVGLIPTPVLAGHPSSDTYALARPGTPWQSMQQTSLPPYLNTCTYMPSTYLPSRREGGHCNTGIGCWKVLSQYE